MADAQMEKALREVARLARESEAAREDLERAIVTAHELGAGYKAIAAATGRRDGVARSPGFVRGILARRQAR